MENPVISSSKFRKTHYAIVLSLLSFPIVCAGQTVKDSRVLSSVANNNTRIRIFYQHDIEDYFYPPIIVRAVSERDPRRDTAPLKPEGRFVFVTMTEIQELLKILSLSTIGWSETSKAEGLGPSYRAEGLGYLDVTVVSSAGTARSGIDRNRVCKLLANLSTAIDTPRALWEFQYYRWIDGCKVENFDPNRHTSHSD
jgi:hypothetical protein